MRVRVRVSTFRVIAQLIGVYVDKGFNTVSGSERERERES
jgi:hypothetical protein